MTTTWMHDHQIVVCSVERATALLMSTNTRGDVDAVISIADPYGGKRPPKTGFYAIPFRLCLTFDDALSDLDGVIAPRPVDAHLILDFARRVRHQIRPGKRFIIHCHAGISRSSAAALLVIADSMNHGEEKQAVGRPLECCERDPVPNESLVRFGDDLLGRGGRLNEAAKAIWTTSPGPVVTPSHDLADITEKAQRIAKRDEGDAS